MAIGQRPQALLTILYCSTDCLSRRGAPVKNLSHSAPSNAGTKHLGRFDRPLIVRIRDKAAGKGRRFANYVKAVLSLLFAWGSERGFLIGNPASGIKDLRRQKGAPDANRPWSDQERDAVLDGAPDHMRPAIALMMFAGLGPKDALTLPRTFAKGGQIATRRSKTGEAVFWPMPAPLADILDNAPDQMATTLCANSRGIPWTLSALAHPGARFAFVLKERGSLGRA
jgi:hypothetical protein